MTEDRDGGSPAGKARVVVVVVVVVVRVVRGVSVLCA